MNIVFDLGGVVFKWQPDEIIARLYSDKKTQNIIKNQILGSPDWSELDRGILTKERAIARGAKRTGLDQSEISKFLNEVPKALTPMPETIKLIQQLKKTKNKLYVLSNMHHASIDYLEQENAIFEIFDGKVISCKIKKVKPEREIYEYLLEMNKLKASETIFIDDMEENLVAAAKLNIKTIHFINAKQSKQALKKLGVFD